MYSNDASSDRSWTGQSFARSSAFILFAMAVFGATISRVSADGSAPQWIWAAKTQDNQTVFFRRAFDLPSPVKKARLVVDCDNSFEAMVNEKDALSGSEWQQPVSGSLESFLKKGKNVLAIQAVNTEGPAGLIARLDIEFEDGGKLTISTSEDWRISETREKDWEDLGHDDSGWKHAKSLGAVGDPNLPWSGVVTAASLDSAAPGDRDAKPHEETRLRHAPDFVVEQIYLVPKGEQGSWVSLTVAPNGRLIASDQGTAGLFQITPPKLDDPSGETKVEKIPVDLSGAHGLVWAFDSLYVDVNEKNAGLYRVRGSNGDEHLDSVEKLRPLLGGGEHGPHAVLFGTDNKSLFVLCGNHTDLTNLAGSLLPSNWKEDLILPRQWDANGHAKGRLAPGGWIARTDPDGKEWTIVSIGYRNMYDAVVNRFGDLFTYDSDMEWDMGMPWYVPTRLCHVISGSEFGWRSGSGRWPAYYEDSLPSVIDIGPGSPTGVVSGAGAKFPTRYQDALFLLDWTFGTIWAAHLSPEGSSYTATKEEFVSGAPLPVTDAVIGADGALYFTIGGRGTQSALYRVTYHGTESLVAPSDDDPTAKTARDARRDLEAFHGHRDPKAVETAWPHLGDADRFLRYAARIAVENQPVEEWQDRALSERDPLAAAVALIALARQGKPEIRPQALEALARFDLGHLQGQTLLAMLRAYELVFIRLGSPDARETERALAQLDPLLPGKTVEANAEVANLLVYLKAPSAIEKCLALMSDPRPQELPDWAEVIKRNPGYGNPIRKMLDNPPPTRGIHYAFILRNLRYGWSMPQRETYFKFIVEASKHPGGASYAGFLRNTRTDALANCSEAERVALASITGESLEAPPPFEVKLVKGPGRQWKMDEAVKTVESSLKGRNFESGRNAYYAVGCNKCHRFDGAGGAIGPDLTTVRNKFSIHDLLEAIIEPSKVVSDQYASSNVSLKDGRYLSGLVIPTTPGDPNSDVEIYTSNPDEPPTRTKRSEIEKIEPSKVSQMPEAAVDTLSADELRDMAAYLLSMGNSDDPMFKK